MRLVITGATGFLGSYFVEQLLKEPGLEIWGVTRSMGGIPGFQSDGIRWMRGDLCSSAFCREVVSGKHVILHLAHSSHPLTSERDFAGDIVSSLFPSANLLQAIAEVGEGAHVVFASSGGAVYGDSDSDALFREDDPCCPGNAYGIQKLMIEHYIRLLASRGILTGCILRITNAYGKLLPRDRKQGLIGVAMARMLAGKPVITFGNPCNVRDYVHVEDVFRAVKCCLSRRGEFEVFNIGSGRGTSVSEVLAMLEQVTGIAPRIEIEPQADDSGLVKRCVVSPEKAGRVLNWHPSIDLEQGIQLMYDVWRQSQ